MKKKSGRGSNDHMIVGEEGGGLEGKGEKKGGEKRRRGGK